MFDLSDPLLSVSGLKDILQRPDVKTVDASWWLDGLNARADFDARRIGKAVFFDLDAVSDHDTSLPHMLPDANRFAKAAGALGLKETDTIVVYDQQGLFSAARVWWMLRLMGARKAVVLNGGLPAWKAAGLPLETGQPVIPAPTHFHAEPDLSAVATLHDVSEALRGDSQIVDARGAARFGGTAPEPRPGMRSGHMPGATNLPYLELLKSDGKMKSGPEIEAAFRKVGVDLDLPVITTCGSGVTAAILTLGLAVMGKSSRLYDGSWAEWGGREDTPVRTA